MKEKPGGLYSPWGHKELDMTEWLTLLFNAYENTMSKVFENIKFTIKTLKINHSRSKM